AGWRAPRLYGPIEPVTPYEPGRRPASVKPPSPADVAEKLKPVPVSCATMLAPGRPPVSSLTVPRMVALVDWARTLWTAARSTRRTTPGRNCLWDMEDLREG